MITMTVRDFNTGMQSPWFFVGLRLQG